MRAKIAYGFCKKRSIVVRYLKKKVKETGILIDKLKRVIPKTVSAPENFAAVAENVCEAPLTSIQPSFSIIEHFGNLKKLDRSCRLLHGQPSQSFE